MVATQVSRPRGAPSKTASPPQADRGRPARTAGPLPRTIDVPADAFGTELRRFSARDLYLLLMLPPLGVIAWALPDRVCAGLCRGLSRLLYGLRPGRYEGYRRVFRLLPPAGHTEARRLDRLIPEAMAMRQLERLQLLRYHRPGGWSPRVRLQGKEHLDRALAAGKGAILWVPHTPFSEVATKIALHQNGYPDWHLYRRTHGHFSSTGFGVRFLNPIRIKVERRYLAGRVVIDPADRTAGLARLAGLLAKNRIVSSAVWGEAARLTMVPYGPGELPLPLGPAMLAIKCRAPLLPVFTERCPDGSLLVTIEAPLEAAADAGLAERVTGMLCRQGELMYAYFCRLPSLYHFAYLHGVAERLRRLAAERGAHEPAA